MPWLAASQLQNFAVRQTDAHRLCTFPDAWIERFGTDLLLSYKTENARERLRAELENWTAESGMAYSRLFGKFLPIHATERDAPVLLYGPSGESLQTVVSENGLRYGMDFGAGYSAGLFIDQRANRMFLRSRKPRRLLNCFSYTCAFSVAAAREGAQTVSVDLSKKSLDRGRANFPLNSLDPKSHQFIADDVLDVLPRMEHRQEKFDSIVLDPPTFSRGTKGKPFQAERDLEKLLMIALELVQPKGAILLSTNCTKIGVRDLETMCRYALRASRAQAELHREPPLPDIPEESAATTLWLLIK